MGLTESRINETPHDSHHARDHRFDSLDGDRHVRVRVRGAHGDWAGVRWLGTAGVARSDSLAGVEGGGWEPRDRARRVVGLLVGDRGEFDLGWVFRNEEVTGQIRPA